MPSIVLVGAQWGDEGKGKLVDYLASKAEWVVRFQGGNNAGHTVVSDGKTYKLSLIPSGILHPDTMCALGTGVVVDPEVFLKEVDQFRSAGIEVTPKRLMIDRDAHIIFAYHRVLDAANEKAKGDSKIGTTGRGIGPAYEDRAARVGVRFAELKDMPRLKKHLEQLVAQKNSYLKEVLKSDTLVDFNEVWRVAELAHKELLPYVKNVGLAVDNAIKSGARVLFEGAQGTLLDQMHGTFPFVTSSNTVAGAAAIGTGIGPNRLDYVLGVVKAYTTRVGSGPFPTELKDADGDFLCEKGHEFGTVTGRKRRCGWLDAVALRRAVRLNGLTSLAVTKLDVLSGLKKVKICSGYTLNGEVIDDVPSLNDETAAVKPQFVELDGWMEDISNVTKWSDLPKAAQNYLKKVEELVGVPISILSIGPDRTATIFSDKADFIKRFSGEQENAAAA